MILEHNKIYRTEGGKRLLVLEQITVRRWGFWPTKVWQTLTHYEGSILLAGAHFPDGRAFKVATVDKSKLSSYNVLAEDQPTLTVVDGGRS